MRIRLLNHIYLYSLASQKFAMDYLYPYHFISWNTYKTPSLSSCCCFATSSNRKLERPSITPARLRKTRPVAVIPVETKRSLILPVTCFRRVLVFKFQIPKWIEAQHIRLQHDVGMWGSCFLLLPPNNHVCGSHLPLNLFFLPKPRSGGQVF